MVGNRISGNQGEYTRIPPRNAGTHRTNSVVAGGKTYLLISSSTTTSLCFSYLSIPIIGRSTPCGFGTGPKLTVVLRGSGWVDTDIWDPDWGSGGTSCTLWRADAGVDDLPLRRDLFLIGDGTGARPVGLGARYT